MRIAVLGAGAIGSVVGALLARDGHEVTLVGRHDHVEAIRRDGLLVDGMLGSFKASVAAVEALNARPDLVLLAVKTQDVAAAVRANLAFLDGVPLVTMQNGVRSDALVAELLPRESLLSCVVIVTATFLVPGHVTLVERGSLVLGRPWEPRDAEVEHVAAVLNAAIPTTTSDNLVGAHWLKLLMNLNNAVPALTNLSLREATSDVTLRRLSVGLMWEGMRVVTRKDILLEDLPGVRAKTVRWMTRLPVSWAARIFASRASRIGGEEPVLGSTLQSLRRGRPTEIDYLNGEVVSAGRATGVPTPLNETVVRLVHGVEADGRFLTPEAVRAATRIR